jgi:hypothetical protein
MNLNIEEHQDWKLRFTADQEKWRHHFNDKNFANYYPRWYIYKIREALSLVTYEGEKPTSLNV